MNKVYRCLNCGFALTVDSEDPRSLEQINAVCHSKELRGVEDLSQCPSCHEYMKRGGRKNGKVSMPDITSAGTLIEETEEVKAEVEQMQKDFEDVISTKAQGHLTAIRQKYGNDKIFGFSVDDLVARHEIYKERLAKEAK
jgi:hypothetical protein